MRLDARLSLLYQMVPPSRVTADIGTDHGCLICDLVGSAVTARGIAADINPLPLEKARRQVIARGLCGKIDLILTDGLTGIPPEDLDTIIIAGMGGETIQHIMASWPHNRIPGITWLLQPMTKAQRLRDWLWQSGFSIRKEDCCTAAGRVYSVMEARYTGEVLPHEEWQRHLGLVDPKRNEDCRRYASLRAEELEKIAQGLARTGLPENHIQGERLRTAAALIRKKL